MTAKTLSLERDICRCCLLEGSFTDLAQPYVYYGKEEVYYDMLKDVFNIEVRPVPGKLCVVTYKICGTCIQKLRDAFLFREQVISSEIQFKQMYERSISEVKSLGLNSIIKEEDSECVEVKDDISSLNSFGDDESMKIEDDIEDSTEMFLDKFEDREEDIDSKFDDVEDETIAELKAKKKTKSKAKPPPQSKKKGRKIKKAREEESDKTEEAEGSAPKKKKGKQAKESKQEEREDDRNYTLTQTDGQELYTCNTCQKSFKSKICFRQHYNHVHLHLRPKVRGCYLCEEKVPAHLRAFHLEKVHGVPAPTCNACGKKFGFPFEVLRHQKIFHMGEKSFTCDVCKMSFARRNNLLQHLVKHSSVRGFKCDYCSEAFKWRKHLARHILSHMKCRSK